MIHPLAVSKQRIQEYIRSLGFENIPSGMKTAYYLPDRKWLAEVFCPALAARQQRDEVTAYQSPMKWVCQDFARHAASFAAELYASASNTPADGGLAVGRFYFTRADDVLHNILFAIVAKNPAGDLDVVNLEPQYPPRIVTLTQKEFDSCYDFAF